ncbi:MAG TPA: TIGR02391 family protein [Cyclobacteriaceae bacterium]|nr:TIGR02391 family protein [Cyclobacteriaceae bacterium]
MLEWFLSINSVLRNIHKKANDALLKLEIGDEEAAKLINGYLKNDYQSLCKLWEKYHFDNTKLNNIERHLNYGCKGDYHDILKRDLELIEIYVEKYFRENMPCNQQVNFEDLIHPEISKHALNHYTNSHFRDAVFNSIVAIFDLIRQRTGLDLDGQNLVNTAFSLDKPYLIFSNLDSESGRNDQKGFIQILNGCYLGIRNPKAHSLVNDINKQDAAQYLVFASLLVKRIHQAKQPKSEI